MKYERSAGAIIYRINGGRVVFLLLKYPAGYWEFARGHLEEGETVLQAARREIREEVCLSGLTFDRRFHKQLRWQFDSKVKGKVSKTVDYYLARVHNQTIKLSDEHTEYRWLTLAQSKRVRMWPNGRTLLATAYAHIRRAGRAILT